MGRAHVRSKWRGGRASVKASTRNGNANVGPENIFPWKSGRHALRRRRKGLSSVCSILQIRTWISWDRLLFDRSAPWKWKGLDRELQYQCKLDLRPTSVGGLFRFVAEGRRTKAPRVVMSQPVRLRRRKSGLGAPIVDRVALSLRAFSLAATCRIARRKVD
jgi:hypothetical protein